MNLYEMNSEIRKYIDQLFESVDEETGEINADVKAALDAMQEARNEKLENVAFYIKNLEAEALALKTEAAKLTARQKAAENHAARLKQYLIQNLTEADEKKFVSADSVISFSVTEHKAVEVESVEALPKMYQRVTKKVEADKGKITEALKAGKKVKGAAFVINKSIRFR